MLDTKNILKTIKSLSESIEKTNLEEQVHKLNETANLEFKQLKEHIQILRTELEKVKANEEDHIQKAVLNANKLINDLKNHIQSLRSELENEKHKNIKDIDELLQGEALKRNELEHTIQNLRVSIDNQLSKQDEVKKKIDLEAKRMEDHYKNALSKLRDQLNNENE